VTGKDPSARSSAFAAYRQGFGLAAVAVISGPAGIRIAAAAEGALAAAETLEARWWCRRAADAERVAVSAAVRLRRRSGSSDIAADISLACESIARAAGQLGVPLRAEAELYDEAIAVAERIEREMERLKQSGGLRSINTSYRQYRIEATERGERVMRYADWMQRYRENLIRELASTLRSL
jgi:hypothetical protein